MEYGIFFGVICFVDVDYVGSVSRLKESLKVSELYYRYIKNRRLLSSIYLDYNNIGILLFPNKYQK